MTLYDIDIVWKKSGMNMVDFCFSFPRRKRKKDKKMGLIAQ